MFEMSLPPIERHTLDELKRAMIMSQTPGELQRAAVDAGKILRMAGVHTDHIEYLVSSPFSMRRPEGKCQIQKTINNGEVHWVLLSVFTHRLELIVSEHIDGIIGDEACAADVMCFLYSYFIHDESEETSDLDDEEDEYGFEEETDYRFPDLDDEKDDEIDDLDDLEDDEIDDLMDNDDISPCIGVSESNLRKSFLYSLQTVLPLDNESQLEEMVGNLFLRFIEGNSFDGVYQPPFSEDDDDECQYQKMAIELRRACVESTREVGFYSFSGIPYNEYVDRISFSSHRAVYFDREHSEGAVIDPASPMGQAFRYNTDFTLPEHLESDTDSFISGLVPDEYDGYVEDEGWV